MIPQERRVIFARRVMYLSSLAGLFVSIYLLITYITGGPIVCGAVHGCDVVRASSWAKTVFGLPRPLLGVAFYVFVLGLLVTRTAYPHKRARDLYHLSMVVATIGIIESAFLTFIQAFDIKAYCLWCLTSGVTATVIFVAAWFDRRDAIEDKTAIRELKFQLWSLVSALVVGAAAIAWLTIPSSDQRAEEITAADHGLMTDAQVEALLLPAGVTFEGPTSSVLTLTEFVDFQCPACKLAHPEVTRVRKELSGQIRFVYRNFPLPEHRDAAGAALGAVCADRQGKLFDYGDVLFANQQALKPVDLVRYAQALQLDVTAFKACLVDPEAKAIVERDVQNGRDLGVHVTPTFFINTTMIDGLPNAEQLKGLIEDVKAGR